MQKPLPQLRKVVNSVLNDNIADKSSQALAFIYSFLHKKHEDGNIISLDEYETLLKHEAFGTYWRMFFDNLQTDSYGRVQNGIIPARAAEFIREEFPFFVIDGKFYLYRNGVYSQDNKDGTQMKALVNNLLPPEKRRKGIVGEILEQLKADPARTIGIDQMNTHEKPMICFLNGVYNPATKEMKPHSPDFRFLNQIPRKFSIGEPLPAGDKIEAFLESLELKPDERRMLLAFCGLCMTTDTGLQRFLILKGLPGSGKSTLLNLLKATIGPENTSERSLERLSDPKERFYAYGVVGKTCNVCADIQTETLLDPTTIKKLTGEDAVAVEPKGVDAYEVTMYAKHFFSANGWPSIKGKDGAFFRRALVLPFNRVPEIPNDHLLQDLTSQCDYFLRICVQALEEYYALTNKQDIESASSKALVLEWQRKSDSVAAFLDEEPAFDEFAGQKYVQVTQVYERYLDYCEDEGRKSLSRTGFYESLKDKGHQITTYHGYKTIRNPYFDKEKDFEPAAAAAGNPFE